MYEQDVTCATLAQLTFFKSRISKRFDSCIMFILALSTQVFHLDDQSYLQKCPTNGEPASVGTDPGM